MWHDLSPYVRRHNAQHDNKLLQCWYILVDEKIQNIDKLIHVCIL